MTRSSKSLRVAVLAAGAVAIAFLSLGVGRFAISPGEILHAALGVLSGIFGGAPGISESAQSRILWEVRLPRVLLAFFAGGGLALAGASLQGVFRNPFVDPHIIGVTAGAAFGGALSLLMGASILVMMTAAFGFGILALGIVTLAASLFGRDDRLIIVLAGIIVAGVFSALVSLVQYSADSEETLPSIVFWLMGSFATANWPKALAASGLILAAALVLIRLRWRINLLSLDDRDAASLGIQVGWLRRGVLFLAAAITAAQVSVSGSIGWVGLVVPHLARMIAGADHRHLMPASFWLGAGFMVLVDDAARTMTSAEIPLGILTALIGAPVFAALLLRSRRFL